MTVNYMEIKDIKCGIILNGKIYEAVAIDPDKLYGEEAADEDPCIECAFRKQCDFGNIEGDLCQLLHKVTDNSNPETITIFKQIKL